MTLDYMRSSKSIAWSVSPKTAFRYNFSGGIAINLVSAGVHRGTRRIYSSGTGRTSRVFYLGGLRLRKGTMYKATMGGVSVDSKGKRFYVGPAAWISALFLWV